MGTAQSSSLLHRAKFYLALCNRFYPQLPKGGAPSGMYKKTSEWGKVPFRTSGTRVKACKRSFRDETKDYLAKLGNIYFWTPSFFTICYSNNLKFNFSNSDGSPMKEEQKNNPLHGLTLETIVTKLVDHYGWNALAEKIAINCFISNPSIKSSLTFLRKTPWARKKVEDLYLASKINSK